MRSNLTHKGRIEYYVSDGSGRIPYYPAATITKKLIMGLSIKTDKSMSAIIEEQLSPLFASMSSQEKEELLMYAKMNKNEHTGTETK